MQTDILIIGQGICGTFLSWYLDRAGVSYIVIDEARSYSASKAAAGLINPVTGRRIVKTWMIDELMPYLQEVYRNVGEDLGMTFMAKKDLIDFFPTPQMRLAFLKRFEEDQQYLQLPADEQAWRGAFRYDFGYGVVSPCYLVDLQALLSAWRKRLQEKQALLEEKFEWEKLITGGEDENQGALDVKGRIRYKDITAGSVIYCDGIGSFSNPFFSALPFAPNKGEALIVELQDLPPLSKEFIFKKGISLTPWKDGLYWAGSSYEWEFTHELPTEAFRKRTEAVLQEWLKAPFTTVEHIASVRPATLERRPFVGFHPRHPGIGILNGMGTKGCSLAPYFAQQLVEQITVGTPIQPDADIKRFRRILEKG